MYLEIITPEQTLFKGDVDSVLFPGSLGDFQVLNNHAPIVSTLKKGEVKIIAGTNPINVRIKAVKIKEIIISLSFSGAIKRFVKFLLQISSRKSMLKLMLDLKRIS